MSSWQNREGKLLQRHLNKEFSKPFKKKHDKNKHDIQTKIREAQRAKSIAMNEEDDVLYE